MYATVVDDIGLDHPVAVGLKNLRHGISEKIVAHMAKMERLVGVWRRILHHDERRILRGLTEAETVVRCDRYVEETLYDIEISHSINILFKPLAHLSSSGLRCFAGSLQERENNYGKVALEFLLGR